MQAKSHVYIPPVSRTASATTASSESSDLNRAAPIRPRNRACAASQCGATSTRFRSPAGVRLHLRSRRSSPDRTRIQPDLRSGSSVRVSVVVSTARSPPTSPCDISPNRDRKCSSVNCIGFIPVVLSSASYACVTARAARLRLAHAQTSGGKGACSRVTLLKATAGGTARCA